MEALFKFVFVQIIIYCIGIPISAWEGMLFHGALADNFGWQTYGYWTYYQLFALAMIVGSALSYSVSYALHSLKEALD